MSGQLLAFKQKALVAKSPPSGEGDFILQEDGLWLMKDRETGLCIHNLWDGIVYEPNIKGVAYIAGPMRGIPKYNFPRFDAAQVFLNDHGFYCFNPAEMDRQEGLTEDTPWKPEALAGCMSRDMEAICKSTHLFLLPDWEGSRGVRPEIILAHTLGLKFITLERDRLSFMLASAVAAVVGARLVGEYQATMKASELN